jgi:glycosyltransferase involved in cell wall biosynthesis
VKLAVFFRQADHISLNIYRENIMKELTRIGIDIVSFTETDSLPAQYDLLWDPGLGMRRIPKILKDAKAPVIATVHGVRVFSLPISELTWNWKEKYQLLMLKMLLIYDWHWFRKKVSAIIPVSIFGADELFHAFHIPRNILYPIYHGINQEIFTVNGEKKNEDKPYLLNISRYRPIKNVDRLLSAYQKFSVSCRPDLVIILPGYKGDMNIKGVKLIKNSLPHEELAKWYRGALGFVLPSLRESFGMPILEAMACGCPVITSHNTGCAEIAGDAALLINPRSVEDIANAMQHLVEDKSLRQSLRQKGLARAQQFTWRKSAEKHLKVFEAVLSEKHEH